MKSVISNVEEANVIVQKIRNMDPPGRLLKEDTTSSCWKEIGDKNARQRVVPPTMIKKRPPVTGVVEVEERVSHGNKDTATCSTMKIILEESGEFALVTRYRKTGNRRGKVHSYKATHIPTGEVFGTLQKAVSFLRDSSAAGKRAHPSINGKRKKEEFSVKSGKKQKTLNSSKKTNDTLKKKKNVAQVSHGKKTDTATDSTPKTFLEKSGEFHIDALYHKTGKRQGELNYYIATHIGTRKKFKSLKKAANFLRVSSAVGQQSQHPIKSRSKKKEFPVKSGKKQNPLNSSKKANDTLKQKKSVAQVSHGKNSTVATSTLKVTLEKSGEFDIDAVYKKTGKRQGDLNTYMVTHIGTGKKFGSLKKAAYFLSENSALGQQSNQPIKSRSKKKEISGKSGKKQKASNSSPDQQSRPSIKQKRKKNQLPVTSNKKQKTLDDSFTESSSSSWIDNNGQEVGLLFEGQVVEKITLAKKEQKKCLQKKCLLNELYGNRVFYVEIPMVKYFSPDLATAEFDGKPYELVGMKKIGKGKINRNIPFQSKNMIRLTYLQSGIVTNGESISIKNTLERFANFSKLPTYKAVARLEHLQTTTKEKNGIFQYKANDFNIIAENGHCGCGFIPMDWIEQMFPTKKHIRSLQVRILCPRIGFFKGMLLGTSSITKIQLPKSMLKVDPSKTNKDDRAKLLVNNIFPSDNNRNLSKYLDKGKKKPPKSFYMQKELSRMYSFVLEGLSSEKSVVNHYIKRSKFLNGVKHTNLIGVADPTGKLPIGKIFLTGSVRIRSEVGPKVLVSRSPCLEPSDVKILPVCEKKPWNMSNKAWSELCSYPFGHIIFPTRKPKGFQYFLPETIAEGDLDGDNYLVMWSKDILNNIEITDDLLYKKPKLCRNDSPTDHSPAGSNWLHKAQGFMLDGKRCCNSSQLISKLYTLCQKMAKDSGAKHIYDENARCFARAFKDALKAEKHGQLVALPRRLHHELPPCLHEYLNDEEECSSLNGSSSLFPHENSPITSKLCRKTKSLLQSVNDKAQRKQRQPQASSKILKSKPNAKNYELPKNWTMECKPVGKNGRIDKYFYTETKKQLRSRIEVDIFLEKLRETNDEDEAYKRLHEEKEKRRLEKINKDSTTNN